MLIYIWLLIFYEILANIQTSWAQQAMQQPTYMLSKIERMLWKDSSLVSLAALVFCAIVRVNGVIFLIYLGFQTDWWWPIVIWISSLVMSLTLMKTIIRGGVFMPLLSLLAFPLLPILAVCLWLTV